MDWEAGSLAAVAVAGDGAAAGAAGVASGVEAGMMRIAEQTGALETGGVCDWRHSWHMHCLGHSGWPGSFRDETCCAGGGADAAAGSAGEEAADDDVVCRVAVAVAEIAHSSEAGK